MENPGRHVQAGMSFTENDVASHSTDLFRPIEQEVSMRETSSITLRPVSLAQAGPFQFNIPSKGNQYIQLAATRLHVRGQVFNKYNGAPVRIEDGVALCNLPANSLFQTIEIDIGGVAISQLQNANCNYKCLVDTLLSYDDQSKQGHLACSGWEPDFPEYFDDLRFDPDEKKNNTFNTGLQARRIRMDHPWEYCVPLHSDLFRCDRLMPPGVDLTVRLIRAKDNFLLMHLPDDDGSEYVIKLIDLRLHVRYVSVTDEIIKRHQELMTKQPILMPIKKTEITAHHFGAGVTNLDLTNLFQNRLPKSLIIGMVATGAYNGTANTNPYNFQHFDVNHVQVIRNGVAIPNEPYTPDWDNLLYNRELRAFFDNIGIQTDNLSCGMTRRLYRGGATLFAFDFSPDLCNGFHWHRREPGGIMDIILKFKRPTPVGGVTVMLFAVYDALVSIDLDQQVMVTI